MRRETLPVEHFDAIYAARPDPWRYATSAYEQAKYAATLAALPRERYRSAFEIGCSTGVFTAMLAARSEALLAAEPVDQARAAARERLRDLAHVRVENLWVPRDWPDDRFDLVLISEVIDYLGEGDVRRLADRVIASLLPGGDVVLVHWVGKKKGLPSGHEASDLLVAHAAGRLRRLRGDRNPDYRLDVLRRL